MSKSPDAFRTISEVADWLGVQAHVLRFWESKFTQVKPVKRAGGRRYYRPADMQLLGGIKKLLHSDGLAIKEVQALLREHGAAHVAELSPPIDASAEESQPPLPPADTLGDNWQRSLELAQDSAAAGAETDNVVGFPQPDSAPAPAEPQMDPAENGAAASPEDTAADPAQQDTSPGMPAPAAPEPSAEETPAEDQHPAGPEPVPAEDAAAADAMPPLAEMPAAEVPAGAEAEPQPPTQPADEAEPQPPAQPADEAAEPLQEQAPPALEPETAPDWQAEAAAEPRPAQEVQDLPASTPDQAEDPAPQGSSGPVSEPEPVAQLEPGSHPAAAAGPVLTAGLPPAADPAPAGPQTVASPAEDTLLAAAGLEPDMPLDFGSAAAAAVQQAKPQPAPQPAPAGDAPAPFPPHDLDEAARQLDAHEFASGFKDNQEAQIGSPAAAAAGDRPAAPQIEPGTAAQTAQAEQAVAPSRPGVLAHLDALDSLPPRSVAGISACAEALRALISRR